MTYIVRVECQGIGRPFGSAPEWLASACHGVLRQTEEQLPDRIIILLFELETSPDNALLEGQWLVCHEIRYKLFDLLALLTRILEVALEVVGLTQIGVDSLSRFDEEVIKLGPSPLQALSVYSHHRTRMVPTSMVCWIALGKFLTVHEGVSFSGGS